MVQTRKDENPEEKIGADGGEDEELESLSIKERRERRRARRQQDDDIDDDDGEDDVVPGSPTTARKDIKTRTRKEAQKERERQSQAMGENLPIIGAGVTYVRGVYSEVKKVTWPTREEAQRLTWIVLAVSIAFSMLLGVIDLFYGWWFELGVSSTSTFLIIAVPFFLVSGSLSWYFIIKEA